MNENLRLKSIGDILKSDTSEYNFFIPSYQRGYRWGEKQVIELLDDISSFSKNKEKEEDFYCLQPIVVNKNNDKYRVIDGQQRLTTIYIILKYFNEVEFKRPKPLFNIFFDTRPSNEEFFKLLDNSFIEKNEISKTDIDKFYISNAFLIIDKWFTKKIKVNPDFIQDFYPVFLNDVKVIWYEIDSKNEIDVFTRLNIGKIPLTNAELIKALFLINIDKENKSEKILLASQWDDMEYKLQDKEFFAFIYNGDFKQPTKIEYIFDIIAKSKNITIENLTKNDDKYSFYIFNELIKSEEDSKKMWGEVKTYFRIFNELHVNNEYYHLVGFLTQTGSSIKDLVDIFKANQKDDFKKELIKLIKSKINLKDKVLKATDEFEKEELKYDNKNSKDIITKILFLFNVISTMQSGHSRYPFDKHMYKHKNEKWSLEHIHAQQSENITNDTDRKELLKSQLDYIENDDELKQKVEKLIKAKEIDSEKFNKIQENIFKLYSDDSSLHTIDNLALLGKDDNSSLSNNIFPLKRDKIKELDKKGSFIPIGTKNVFLKYYSNNVKDGLMWNEEDRKAYLRAIKDTLTDYLGDK
jgi:hypothetical protein